MANSRWKHQPLNDNKIAIRSHPYMLTHREELIKERPSNIQRKRIVGPITIAIIVEAHEGIIGGHFSTNITLHKVLRGFILVAHNEEIFFSLLHLVQYLSKGWTQNLNKSSASTPSNAYQGIPKIGFGFYWTNQFTGKEHHKSVHHHNH